MTPWSAANLIAVRGGEPVFIGTNPFAGGTRIEFVVDRPGIARLTVCDVTGRRVRTLLDGEVAQAGARALTWNGRRDDGRGAPPGVYWVRLAWAGGVDQHRLVKLGL